MSYFKGAAVGLCGLVVAAAGSFATYQFLEDGFGMGDLLFGIKNVSGAERRGHVPRLPVMLNSDADGENNVIGLNNLSDPEQKGPIATSSAEGESTLEEKENAKGKRLTSRKGRGVKKKTKDRKKESGKDGEKVVVGTNEDADKKTIIVAEKAAVEEKEKPREEPTDGQISVVGAPGIDSVQEVVSVSDKTDLKQSPDPGNNGNNRTQSSAPKEQGTPSATSAVISEPQTKPAAPKAPAKPAASKPQVTKSTVKSKPASHSPSRSYSIGIGRFGLPSTLPFSFLMMSRNSGY